MVCQRQWQRRRGPLRESPTTKKNKRKIIFGVVIFLVLPPPAHAIPVSLYPLLEKGNKNTQKEMEAKKEMGKPPSARLPL
jgi:hypothetical protein